MAGLLDWLDSALGGAAKPPVQMTGTDAPPIPNPAMTDIAGGMQGAGPPPPLPQGTDPMTAGLKPPTPDPLPTQPMPPPQALDAPPLPPFAQGGDPMQASPQPMPQGGDPMAGTGSGQNGGLPPAPPPPLPQARPAGAGAPIPTMATPPTPPGAPMPIAPPAAPPIAPGGTNGFQAPPTGPAYVSDQQGRGGILSRALGLSPDQSNKMAATLGAGLTAAGNSAGKSPMQAIASGAGAALEGGSKEQHQNTKDAQGYLAQAIAAKKAGDDSAYKTNYTQYLAAKLKADTDKVASKDAAGNKNDSPTQLYLSAQRLVQPERNAVNKQIAQMQKDGAPPDQIAKAKAEGEAAIQAKLNDHFAAVGIHPQTASQLAQQPGMTEKNPIDGKAVGLTKENAAKKLQPGQYYTNPSDGKLYQYKGPADTKGKSSPSKPGKPEPADPMKPEKGARMSMAATGAEDDE